MATPVQHLIQDQNSNLLYAGATLRVKTNNVSNPGKKGPGGGRKALNDISNSRRPSVLQSTKKENSTSVISKDKNSFDANAKSSKVPQKGKTVGSRKALADLTNYVKVKLSSQPLSRIDQKFSTGENVPSSLVEERFLHDHQKCTGAQTKAVDVNYFLETAGLNNSDMSALKSSSIKSDCSKKRAKLDEIPEKESQCKNSDPFGSPPLCKSPISLKPPYMNWDEDDLFDLSMIESPKLC